MSTASSTSTTVRRRVAGAGLALGLVGVAVVGGSSWAGAAGSDATLYACAKPNGDLHLVPAGTACKNDERAVSWSTTGPQGPQGVQGPQGEVGPQGPQGPPGSGPAAPPTPSRAGYLDLPDVHGSGTGDFPGQLPVLAWSWGASNAGTTHTGTGGGSGRANVQDISVSVPQEPASVVLLEDVLTGAHLQRGTLTLCGDAGCTPGRRTVIALQTVLVTSLTTGGSGAAGDADNVTLNFAEFQMTRGDQTLAWDIVANRQP